MPETIYLYLLIFCGIWSQGIIPTFADENNKTSSDFLDRQKRVISYEHGGAEVVRIEQTPYIVYVKTNNQNCVGTILSHRIVISIAECAQSRAADYKIVSKSAHTNHHGSLHNVTNIRVHNGNLHGRPSDGIALFAVDPVFVYGPFIRNIELHVGLLLPGMHGTITGWGYNVRNRVIGPGTNYPKHLRSIELPIIPHQDCVERYRNYYPITDKDICTFHPLRSCGHSDGGAPLVIDNLLVGIFLRSGPLLTNRFHCDYPEVFALLQHTDYSDWIRANM